MKVWNSICESLIHTDGQNQAALAASTKKKKSYWRILKMYARIDT